MTDPKLDILVEQMRNVAHQMIPYSYPRMPASYEDNVYPLRIRETTVDGYPIVIYYGIADHGHHRLETAQTFARTASFLPFSLVVKIGTKFLGTEGLSLIEMFKDDRKIYCWTVYRDRDGKPGKAPFRMPSERCVYEGFVYDYMAAQAK